MTDTVNSRARLRPRRLLAAAAIGVTIGCLAAPIVVTEETLHIQVRPLPDRHEADAIARDTASAWESARVTAADAVALDGWLFTPRAPNGSDAILLHGVGDTRRGMVAHAAFLLRAGYTVLMPDLRGHGASGGSVISYGVRESSDVHTWVDWLLRKQPIAHLYGLGQSMGAAILIESLAREPRFRALVADCPFDSFEDVAFYRLENASGLGRWATWPVVETGLLYTRLVHGVDLRQASPARVIRSTTTPILLIHGTADTHIPPGESIALHALNPQSTALWLVPGAGHVASLSRDPREYARRVTEWFRSHPRNQ
jgi:pimeloyl-ACP methyl ester carboxylesterase